MIIKSKVLSSDRFTALTVFLASEENLLPVEAKSSRRVIFLKDAKSESGEESREPTYHVTLEVREDWTKKYYENEGAGPFTVDAKYLVALYKILTS